MTGSDTSADAAFLSPRRVATWVIAAALLLGILLQAPGFVTMFQTAPGVTWIALAGGIVQTLLLLVAAWFVLPRGRARTAVVVVAVALGIFPAMGIASVFNALVDVLLGDGASLVYAPFLEELLKLACAAAVLWALKARLRDPLDGLVIGFFVGLGFEVFEDVTYTYNAGAGADGDTVTVLTQIVTRTLLGFGLHNMFTAITAAALTVLILGRRRGWLIALGGLLLSIAMHWIWDNVTFFGIVGKVIEYAVIIAVFFVVRARCHSSERIRPASESS